MTPLAGEIASAKKAVREIVVGGLRLKAIQNGEYTSLLVQDRMGRIVFRGAIIFQSWPELKKVFQAMSVSE